MKKLFRLKRTVHHYLVDNDEQTVELHQFSDQSATIVEQIDGKLECTALEGGIALSSMMFPESDVASQPIGCYKGISGCREYYYSFSLSRREWIPEFGMVDENWKVQVNFLHISMYGKLNEGFTISPKNRGYFEKIVDVRVQADINAFEEKFPVQGQEVKIGCQRVYLHPEGVEYRGQMYCLDCDYLWPHNTGPENIPTINAVLSAYNLRIVCSEKMFKIEHTSNRTDYVVDMIDHTNCIIQVPDIEPEL